MEKQTETVSILPGSVQTVSFVLNTEAKGQKGLLSTCMLHLNPRSASVTGTNSETPKQIHSWQSFREQPQGTSNDSRLHLNCG